MLADGEVKAVGTKDEVLPELLGGSGVCRKIVQ